MLVKKKQFNELGLHGPTTANRPGPEAQYSAVHHTVQVSTGQGKRLLHFPDPDRFTVSPVA